MTDCRLFPPTPLLTAAQAAEMRPLKSATPPAEPKPEPFEVEPSPAAVAALAACRGSGGQEAAARQIILAANREQAAKLKIVSLETYDDLQATRASILHATQRHQDILAESNRAINEVESLLIQRGETFRAIAADEALLADATTRLASLAALEIEPAELLKLEQRRQMLPTRIEDHRAATVRLRREILAAAAPMKLDVAAIGAEMARGIYNERGQVVNSQVQQLHNAGWLGLE